MRTARVLITFGTDHHPFDRLAGWVAALIEALPASPNVVMDPAEIVVQHGGTHPIDGCTNVEFLSGEEMLALMAAADAVVCSAGPGAIMDSRRAGRRPIVVARHSGEAVDDHQRAFAAHADAQGLALSVASESAFVAAVLAELADPGRGRVEFAEHETAPEGVLRIGPLIDRLVWGGDS